MTIILLIITVLASISAFQSPDLKAKLMFNASLVKHSNQWYRVLTHAFIHADWFHLMANGYVLWMFGDTVEYYMDSYRGEVGQFYFLSLYLGGILCSSLPAFVKHQDNFYYNSLGASGAVSSVLFAAIFFDPMATWGLVFIPFIEFPAILFGVAYLLFEWYMDKKSNDNIAHDAHFWGAAFGIVFAIAMFPSHLTIFIEEIRFAILG
ncbi:rhomboid family intramembrane serine protease [Flavobacteriales bacterium]|nr:rhomboid family intramembrane serine protease [Flavobacteriales bacterium]